MTVGWIEELHLDLDEASSERSSITVEGEAPAVGKGFWREGIAEPGGRKMIFGLVMDVTCAGCRLLALATREKRHLTCRQRVVRGRVPLTAAVFNLSTGACIHSHGHSSM